MKAKWLARIRRIGGQNVIRRTQSRLTIMYSGILMLFLAVFTVLMYGTIYLVIINDQEEELQNLANQDLRTIQTFLKLNETIDPKILESEGLSVLTEGQLFYYIVSPDGKFLYGREAGRWMKPQLANFLAGRLPDKNVVLRGTLHVPEENEDSVFDEHPWDRKIRQYRVRHPFFHPDRLEVNFLAAARPLKQGDNVIGTLVIGKNVSYHYSLLTWLVYIFGGLGTVFFGVALYFSHHMSKWAMIPIVEAYQRRREFVADASHELRTPLSVMMSSIDALEMEQTDNADPIVSKMLANMRNEVKRMSRMVGALLTIASLEDRYCRLRRETADFWPHAENIAQSMRAIAESRQIKLDFASPEPLVIHADIEGIKQLLYILLDNAIKYTPSGGKVRLKLVLDEGRQRTLTVIVEDTGEGIPKEEQKRIFDRFYRVNKARSRQTGGHGLGLSIARRIVDAHDGTITVNSAPGNGTRFTVTIPV